MSTVRCVKVDNLRQNGYTDLDQWMSDPNNLYVGRRGRIFIYTGTEKRIFHYPGNKWQNPYNLKDYSVKESLTLYVNHLFESKRFKGTETISKVSEQVKNVKLSDDKPKDSKSEETLDEGPPKYTKSILKKGDKTNFPKKGDVVHCWYTGTLPDGTVFDTNIQTSSKKKKNAKPLSFKVGVGKVIRGWDEALLTMSKGEKARLEIEPEWAYGKKGQPDAKIPPNTKLIFEVELLSID